MCLLVSTRQGRCSFLHGEHSLQLDSPKRSRGFASRGLQPLGNQKLAIGAIGRKCGSMNPGIGPLKGNHQLGFGFSRGHSISLIPCISRTNRKKERRPPVFRPWIRFGGEPLSLEGKWETIRLRLLPGAPKMVNGKWNQRRIPAVGPSSRILSRREAEDPSRNGVKGPGDLEMVAGALVSLFGWLQRETKGKTI